jgi:hypothetical protein
MPMGMGDRPKPYTPSYAPVRCDVSGYRFAQVCIRECKEPHVVERYGIGGVCHVSIYVCRKCKYREDTPFCGAVGCKYGLEQRVQDGA